jgi:hypothetical protein
VTLRTGWPWTTASTGRNVPSTSSRAASRRRATYASQSSVAPSLQCRSSSTSTRGRAAVKASTASASSRSMRSRVTPLARRCRVSSSGPGTSVGRCSNQLGAYWRSSAASSPPADDRPSWPIASNNGRYASPEPWCSMHCPRPTQRSSWTLISVTKASTSVVLPIPTSPVTNTTCRRPWHAAVYHCCNCASSAARPTSTVGALAVANTWGRTGASSGALAAVRSSTAPTKR